MNKPKKKNTTQPRSVGDDFFERVWEESWTYIKTVVDVVRQPVLILDKNLCVMTANEPFYETFLVKPEETEKHVVYELGNGQWDIPVLRKLLVDIVTKDTYFKGFEVAHEFPDIGRKVMILNARQIYFKNDSKSAAFQPIILLVMEDVTEMINVAENLAGHTNRLQKQFSDRVQTMEEHINTLTKEVESLKQDPGDKTKKGVIPRTPKRHL